MRKTLSESLIEAKEFAETWICLGKRKDFVEKSIKINYPMLSTEDVKKLVYNTKN